MKYLQTINGEVMREAMRKANVVQEKFTKILTAHKEERERIVSSKIDIRDILDLGVTMYYLRKFEGTGDVMSDQEFEEESSKLIKAFANNDRDAIFGYLDKWTHFVANYECPEHIETLDDSIKNFIYLRSQQGLGVTKMREYPDYVASRYPTARKLQDLQRIQSEVTLQEHSAMPIYHEHSVTPEFTSIIKYDHADEAEKKRMAVEGQIYLAVKAQTQPYLDYALDLMNASKETDDVVGTEQAGIMKVPTPDWVGPKGIDDLNSAIRGFVGATETGFGMILKYESDNDKKDIELYKFFFIDGVNVFDSLPEPKSLKDAQTAVANALKNQTGVVTLAQPLEVDGKFTYRVDVIDTRTGNNDNPEYVEKMQALESEEARKALYATVDGNLTPFFEAKREETIRRDVQTGKNNLALNEGKQSKAMLIDVNEKVFGPAFFVLDNVRDAYAQYSKEPLAKYDLTGIDQRDFIDLAMITKLAGTLGVGERDLNDAEYKTAVETMIKAFANQDHDAMKPYLDRLYNFVENYQVPSTIETTNDFLRAVTCLRLQQASSVKAKENAWYMDSRYPTPADKAKYSALESTYYTDYQHVDLALKLASGVNFGTSLKRYSDIFRTYKQNLAENNPANDPNVNREENFYIPIANHYSSERRARLADDNQADKRYIFKIELPENATVHRGEVTDPDAFEDSAKAFYRGFFDNVFPEDFSDSLLLKNHGLLNKSGEDVFRLMYIDGESIYDKVFGQDKKVTAKKLTEGYKMLFSALVNQSGLVQVAHLQNENGELKVELDTLDVSSNGKLNTEYSKKLAEYEQHPEARYNAIKEQIQTTCTESKRVYDAEKARIKAEKTAEEHRQQTELYNAEQKGFEDDMLHLGDVFDTREFDVNGVVEKAGVDKAQSRVLAFNRSAVLQGMLNEIATYTNSDLDVNDFIGRLNFLFDEGQFNKEEYNDTWKTLWKDAVDGLKDNAELNGYDKPIPFSYVTGMVERFMKGALKLYDHENVDVDLFGGMTLDEMTDYITENVPTWEEKHQNDYYSKLSPKQLIEMPDIEEQFALWKKTPLQSYRNLTGVKIDKKYLNEKNHFNDEGKKWVSDKLISFYDRINLIADGLDDATLEHTDEETLRREMHEFADQIKGVILGIKVYDEEQFNERTGSKLPIEKDLEKFRTNTGRMIEVEEQLKAEHREEYERGEARQWNNLVNSGVALGENENRPERQIGIFDEALLDERKEASQARKAEAQARQEKKEAVRQAIVLNFTTFKNGRYSKPKNDPASAFSIAVDSQYSHLDDMIFAKPRRVRNYERLNKADVNVSIELEGEQKNIADEFAYKTGVKINPDQLQFVLSNFIEQNKSSNGLSVDTNALGLQYRLLTADLYLVALNNLNRRAVKNGETVTAEQMTETYDMLNKMMKNAAKACAYPENLPNGELTKEQLFNFRNNFAERLVPKDSRQMAMRAMQATTKGFDFGKIGWNTTMGYTEFLNVINNAKSRLNDNELQTPEGQMKVAQMYGAMVEYNHSRTGWSKFVNFRKNRKEVEAIERFKELALAKSGLTEREFNEKTAVTENEGWTNLKNDICTANLVEKNEARQNEQQMQQQNEINRQVERINVREAENKKVEKREQVKKEEQHQVEVQNNVARK